MNIYFEYGFIKIILFGLNVLSGTLNACDRTNKRVYAYLEGGKMKVDAAIYRYIEHELYNYKRYKKELELERQVILDSSPLPPDGQPRGTALSNPTEKKVMSLWSNIGIVVLQRSISAIEQTYLELDEDHRKVFIEVYERQRKDWYWIGHDLGMAERTIMRKKSNIVMLAGKNLGVIR